LRVVTGAVLASEGTLVVVTRNRRIQLRPERDGTTTVVDEKPADFPIGTRVEISFGPAIPSEPGVLGWAWTAIRMARFGQTYAGKTSPWWYDVATFHELLYASGATPVREVVANLDGCTGAKAGEIVAAAGLVRGVCNGVTRDEAERLLRIARIKARQVKPDRLGTVGADAFPNAAYACEKGEVASIPYVVEAWAEAADATALRSCCVNRTPVTGDIRAVRDKRDIDVYGCGLAHMIAQAPKEAHFDIWLNITTPYMPITSDGKAPNLAVFLDPIAKAAASAVRKARRPRGGDGKTQKDVVLDNLDVAIAKVSGDGKHRFNQRQVLYALRPIVKGKLDKELTTANFTAIITDHESEHGEIPGMYREPRGSIYHPHRDETITLGTLMVEDYDRPAWTFNKLLYIEKEGFSEALKDVRWGERHDCAIMSSKGFSTRAARDLIDKLAEHDEPIAIFCVHDADASGTMIYQTLQQATKARGARKVAIINLGLEPDEARVMGLEVEAVEEKDRYKPVADYASEWAQWLQTKRVELNAMTTPQLIEWLDGKMADHDKLIPPLEVLDAELAKRIETNVRTAVTERVLREAGFEDQVAAAIAAVPKLDGAALEHGIKQLFEQEPDREWRDHIEKVALSITNPE
jgi:hypothetical protein